MRLGDRISKNSQLDAYLVGENYPHTGKAQTVKVHELSWTVTEKVIALSGAAVRTFLTALLCTATLSWTLCNQNITRKLQYLGCCTSFDSHTNVSVWHFLGALCLFYFSVAMLCYGSHWVLQMLSVMLLTPCFSGYLASSLTHDVFNKMHIFERCIVKCCESIKKVQLSLAGRELLHPLPPVSKLEEFVMQSSGVDSKRVAMSSLRRVLMTTVSSLLQLLASEMAALRCGGHAAFADHVANVNKLSAEQKYSTFMITKYSQITLGECLPMLLELSVKSWSEGATFSAKSSTDGSLEQWAEIICGFWNHIYVMMRSIQSMYVVSRALDSCLVSLDNMTRSCNWSLTDSAEVCRPFDPGINSADGSSSTDHAGSLHKSFLTCRAKLLQLKCQCEGVLMRVYLCEEHLSSMALPLMAYTQSAQTTVRHIHNDEDNSTDLCVSSLPRRDVARMLETTQNALLLLCGLGLIPQERYRGTFDVDDVVQSARVWNFPSEEDMTDTVSSIAAMVRDFDRHCTAFVSTHDAEFMQQEELLTHQAVSTEEDTSPSKPNFDNKVSDDAPPKPDLGDACEFTCFGDVDTTESMHDRGGDVAACMDNAQPVDVITATVMSDAEIKVLNDDVARKARKQASVDRKHIQLSKKLMGELSKQIHTSKLDRLEVERTLDGLKHTDSVTESDISKSVNAAPPVVLALSPIFDVGLHGELKHLLQGAFFTDKSKNVQYLGDSSSEEGGDPSAT